MVKGVSDSVVHTKYIDLVWHVLSALRFEALVQSITIVSGIETPGARSRERKAETGQG